MGSIYKKAVTRPLPADAEIIVRQRERLARWRGRDGKLKTAVVITGPNGTDRIREESSTFYAKHRDGSGIVVEVPTGCRTTDAARQVLADLKKQAERVRSGLLTSAEARTAEHFKGPIGSHLDAYITSLEASGASPKHIGETRRVLNRVFNECGFGSLGDLERSAVEHWLNRRRQEKASGRTRNIDLTHLIAFGNWCVANARLTLNPFCGIPKANEAETRRRRRAMTEEELTRLLDVARHRPLLEALTVRRGKRKGETYAKVRDATRHRLEALGRERALIYKTLVLSGLRKGELTSLTVAQVRLDGAIPCIELDAADEKNRQGNGIVIRADLADDLRHWLADKLTELQAEARRRGEPIPARLPVETPLFYVPDKLIKIFDRDLKAASIAKRDERGRTLDVHALRTTFGTLLSKGGVPLRTAQAAMRHADPSLTANVYTDPKLLDVHGALDALPKLPLDVRQNASAAATGTYGRFSVALSVAPNGGNEGQTESIPDKTNGPDLRLAGADGSVVTAESVKDRDVLTTPDSHSSEWAMQDLNLRPPACRAGALAN